MRMEIMAALRQELDDEKRKNSWLKAKYNAVSLVFIMATIGWLARHPENLKAVKEEFKNNVKALQPNEKPRPQPTQKEIFGVESAGPITVGTRNKAKEDFIEIVYKADKDLSSPDIHLPKNIPDGTSKTFTIELNDETFDIQTSPQTPQNLIRDIYKKYGSALILFGDCEHRSIGILREKNRFLLSTKPTHVFTEWDHTEQKLYDEFATAWREKDPNSNAIESFQNQISQRHNDYYKPKEANLVPLYYEATHASYEIAADNKIDLRFVDIESSFPASLEATKAFNRGIYFISGYTVLQRFLKNPHLSVDELIAPVEVYFNNINSLPDKKITEDNKLEILNIAKKEMNTGFKRFGIYPENWPQGSVDFSMSLDKKILDAVIATKKEHEREIDAAEQKRDLTRNQFMSNNVAQAYRERNKDVPFRAMSFIGQGHYNGADDIDEQLKAALPDLPIVRIDIVPCSNLSLLKLGSQVAQGKYQGSDYIIFTPCPTTAYNIIISNSKPQALPAPRP